MKTIGDVDIDHVMRQVVRMTETAQRVHLASFHAKGSVDYSSLGHELVSMSKVPGRVRKALETLDEISEFSVFL